jgi:curved DNA-binding protein CbpA
LALLGFIYWSWGGSKKAPPSMTRDEAARLLGVAPDADAAAIGDAHKRLIARVHPDAGGSAELAARVNQARDVLLNGTAH